MFEGWPVGLRRKVQVWEQGGTSSATEADPARVGQGSLAEPRSLQLSLKGNALALVSEDGQAGMGTEPESKGKKMPNRQKENYIPESAHTSSRQASDTVLSILCLSDLIYLHNNPLGGYYDFRCADEGNKVQRR